MFTSSSLLELRRKALKGRFWFKVLDGVERGILSLSARLFEVIHDGALLVELQKIVDKLVDAGKSPFRRHLDRHGIDRATKVFDQFRRLGYSHSEELLSEDFVRYLMFLDYNQPIGWGAYPRGLS